MTAPGNWISSRGARLELDTALGENGSGDTTMGVKSTKNKTKVVRASYLRGGKRENVDVEVADSGEPDDLLIEEASKYLQTLEDNKQLAYGTGPLPPGATHNVETRPDGTKRVTRKRFSAI